MLEINVSGQIAYNPYRIDEELMPIQKCLCGQEFGHWEFVIGIYPDNPSACPRCGRKFFYKIAVDVYEVVDV